MTKRKRETAVVVGAVSEPGALYAAGLARRNYNLLLVDGGEEELVGLAGELALAHDVAIDIHISTLSTRKCIDELVERMRADVSTSLLVHMPAPVIRPFRQDSDTQGIEALLWATVTAPTLLARKMATRLASLRRGAIVLVCPTVSLRSRMHHQASVASDAYLVAFVRTLQGEMREHGVLVQAVVPQLPPGALWDDTQRATTPIPDGLSMDAGTLVAAALVGLDQAEEWVLPTLPDMRHWRRFEQGRATLFRELANGALATRYGKRLK